jgi:hypothetical protein
MKSGVREVVKSSGFAQSLVRQATNVTSSPLLHAVSPDTSPLCCTTTTTHAATSSFTAVRRSRLSMESYRFSVLHFRATDRCRHTGGLHAHDPAQGCARPPRDSHPPNHLIRARSEDSKGFTNEVPARKSSRCRRDADDLVAGALAQTVPVT